jgi:hypothetical protein
MLRAVSSDDPTAISGITRITIPSRHFEVTAETVLARLIGALAAA